MKNTVSAISFFIVVRKDYRPKPPSQNYEKNMINRNILYVKVTKGYQTLPHFPISHAKAFAVRPPESLK